MGGSFFGAYLPLKGVIFACLFTSKSSKELNVAEFIERKHPANFFHKISQDLGISEKYQIKAIPTEQDKKDISFLSNIKNIEEERVKASKTAKLLDNPIMMSHASKEIIEGAKKAKFKAESWQSRVDNLLETFSSRKIGMSSEVKKSSEFMKVVNLQEHRQLVIKNEQTHEKSLSSGFSR